MKKHKYILFIAVFFTCDLVFSQGPPPPPPPPGLPIDGGLLALLGAAVLYGVKCIKRY